MGIDEQSGQPRQPSEPAAPTGQATPQPDSKLLVAEFTQAREELRYQDNHIWNVAKFYLTALSAVATAFAVILRPPIAADVQKMMWFAVMGAGIPLILFGLLLFHRVLAHRVYFRAWCDVTDVIRKQILRQNEWFRVPLLLYEEEGKTHRLSRWMSWHNTLLVVVLVLNATLSGIVALAAFQAKIMPLLPAGLAWLAIAAIVVAAAQIVFATVYRCTVASQLSTAKGYNREKGAIVDVSKE